MEKISAFTLNTLQEHFQCGICYSLVTPNKAPLECSNCRNQIFCTQCVEAYAESKQMTTQLECPYCNQKCKFLEVSEAILEILKLFPVTNNREVSKFCVICGKFATSNHVCLQRDLCIEHARSHSQIDIERVADQQMAYFSFNMHNFFTRQVNLTFINKMKLAIQL